MIPSVTLLFFSPTGSTRRITTLIGNCLADKVTSCNLLKTTQEKQPAFAEKDFVIVGVPVYGGRVPPLALQAIKRHTGSNTPAVSVAVYGNRHYDDALVELNDALIGNGFHIFASAAFVAQHSIVNAVAQGRPDDDDRREIEEFATQILEKYASEGPNGGPVSVPGCRPYKEFNPPAIAPYSTESCTRCGSCVGECPTNAITLESTDAGKCILCMRCVSLCPYKARVLPQEYLDRVSGFLHANCSSRRANDVFL